MFKKSLLPFYIIAFLAILGVTVLAWSATVTVNAADNTLPSCNFPSEVVTLDNIATPFGTSIVLSGFAPNTFYTFTAEHSGDFDLVTFDVDVFPSDSPNSFYGPSAWMFVSFLVQNSASPGEQTDLTINIYNEIGQIVCSDTLAIRISRWTPWYDRDDPSGTGDWENRSSQPGACQGQIPLDFQARTVNNQTPASQTGEVFSAFSGKKGLVCRNNQQVDGMCLDYEVRYYCP